MFLHNITEGTKKNKFHINIHDFAKVFTSKNCNIWTEKLSRYKKNFLTNFMHIFRYKQITNAMRKDSEVFLWNQGYGWLANEGKPENMTYNIYMPILLFRHVMAWAHCKQTHTNWHRGAWGLARALWWTTIPTKYNIRWFQKQTELSQSMLCFVVVCLASKGASLCLAAFYISVFFLFFYFTFKSKA